MIPDASVNKATGYDLKTRIRFLTGAKNFCLRHRTDTVTPPARYQISIGGEVAEVVVKTATPENGSYMYFQTLITTYKTIRRHNAEAHN
jgi:hypothetical protein